MRSSGISYEYLKDINTIFTGYLTRRKFLYPPDIQDIHSTVLGCSNIARGIFKYFKNILDVLGIS